MSCIDCEDNTLPQGKNGLNGLFGGFSGKFKFNNTLSDVGINSTQLRFNNNTSNAITEIYISNLNSDLIDYTLFLDSFNNSGNYGYIKIFKEFDSTKFWIGKITNIVNNGSYHTLTVSYIFTNSTTILTNTFVNSEDLIITFTPMGAQGAIGVNGNSGTTVLYNDFSNVSNNTLTNGTLKLITVSANQLSNNGDYLELSAVFSANPYQVAGKNFNININGILVTSVFTISSAINITKYVLKIHRKTSTNLYLEVQTLSYDINGVLNSSNSVFLKSNITVLDLVITSLNIDIQGLDYITLEQTNLTYFKK